MCVCAQQYSSCVCISVTSTFVLFCWYAVLVRPNWVKTSNNDLFTVSASTVRWTCVTYNLSWVVLLLWVCGKVGSSLVGLVLWHWGMAAGITDLNSDLWHNKERYDDWRVQPHHEMPQLLLLLPVHGDCFWLWLLMDTFMKLQFHLTPLEYTFPAKNGPLHLRIICCEANQIPAIIQISLAFKYKYIKENEIRCLQEQNCRLAYFYQFKFTLIIPNWAVKNGRVVMWSCLIYIALLLRVCWYSHH